MKTKLLIDTLQLLVYGLVIVWLTSCKHDSLPVALDEQPQILFMSLPGIPQQNINIDQKTYTITVELPASLPALEMIPTFTLSQQANLHGDWADGKKAVSLAYYCPATYYEWGLGAFKPIEPVRVDNLRHVSYYTIKLKSKGEALRLKPLLTPIIYDSKGKSYDIIVPVENYYGSSFIEYIAVTKTGSITPLWIGPGGGPMEYCAGLLNQVKIALAGYKGSIALQPGLHDLDLWLADGTKVHATGVILVK
jgi:hypothetical protein